MGKCPACGINLKEPPFDKRETNEVLLTLKFRDFADNNKKMVSIEKAGYCEICDASLEVLNKQKALIKN